MWHEQITSAYLNLIINKVCYKKFGRGYKKGLDYFYTSEYFEIAPKEHMIETDDIEDELADNDYFIYEQLNGRQIWITWDTHMYKIKNMKTTLNLQLRELEQMFQEVLKVLG